MQKTDQQGFTFIEMSIVLVIIGLIVGGILMGRDLIRAAEVRATATQLERFNTAVMTFKGKYDCIPGDCANPSQFGLPGAANTTSFMYNWLDGTLVENQQDFWGQLQAAKLIQDAGPGGYPSSVHGFIAAPGYASPTCPICKQTSAQCQAAGAACTTGGWTPFSVTNLPGGLDCSPTTHYGTLGSVPNKPYVWWLNQTGATTGGWGGTVTPADAAMLDQKIDDGKPLTGSVIAISDYSYSDTACSGNNYLPAISLPNSACVNTASNTYITTNHAPCIDLMLPASFQ